ncbi:suppressor of lurcher protein 1-like isoform X3 [Rhodnius prolixus]|uniref:suppressor of lurcher protein 1-like isoform X3 n=1 Tax=Rhodnius prolixus TaxID=13249 RepID=UPI003D18B301
MERWLILTVSLGSILMLTGQALNPGCECLVYTGTFGKEYGRFSTPDYPKSYPDNINCILYTFIAGPTEIVEINFRQFDLHPSSEDCSTGDYLRVYLELDSARVSELSPVTGLLCSALPSLPHLLYSSGSVLILELHTSHRPTNANYSGFVGTFRFIDTSKYVMPGGTMGSCDYKLYETKPTGLLYSPKYPSSYPRNTRCTYTISARDFVRVCKFSTLWVFTICVFWVKLINFMKEINIYPLQTAPLILLKQELTFPPECEGSTGSPREGGQVRLIFEEFDLQRGDISCLLREDVVRVHDGTGPLSPVIKFLCNQGANTEVISTKESLFIEFTSTSIWPGHGFKAVYHFVHKAGPSCDVKLNSDIMKNGSITSPGFPGPYPPKTTCQYEFIGSGRERIQLVFTDFSLFAPNELPKDCEGVDRVVAFVILDGRMEKIDSYCGVTIPKSIMSNGPRLLVRFTAIHSSRHARGFRAKFHFTTNFAMRGGEQVDDYPCAFRYKAGSSMEGQFTSPNFPGLYPRETECHYFFHGAANHRVRIIFHYFDIEGVHPCDMSSASDYVEFSNFMGLDRKYTRQCGQITSGMIVESERKFFRVTFRSNDRLDATGFNATYQFLEQVTVAPTVAPASTTSQLSYNLMVIVFGVIIYWKIT